MINTGKIKKSLTAETVSIQVFVVRLFVFIKFTIVQGNISLSENI